MARTVNLALKPPAAYKVDFYPDVTSLGDDTLLLAQKYSVTTLADGTGSISLPTKVSGTIRWTTYLPSANGSTKHVFYLGPGAAINLEDVLAAGVIATQT